MLVERFQCTPNGIRAETAEMIYFCQYAIFDGMKLLLCTYVNRFLLTLQITTDLKTLL